MYRLLLKADLYVRNKSKDDKSEGIELLDKSELWPYFSFTEDTFYRFFWSEKNRYYECFAKQAEGDGVLYYSSFTYHFKIPEKIENLLFGLGLLFNGYTIKSRRRELEQYPYILQATNYTRYDFGVWQVGYEGTKSLSFKTFFSNREEIKSGRGLAKAKKLAKDIDKLFNELKHFKFNINNLEKKNNFARYYNKIPEWLKAATATGGEISIKVAVKSLGQDVDIDFKLGSDRPTTD